MTTSGTENSLDLKAIRKRAEYVPVWDERVQCADPCYICGGRAVTYINPAIAAAAPMYGTTKLYAVCKEHAGQPWDLHGGCRSDALALLTEVERLEQRLAETTEQLRRRGEVVEAARRFDDALNEFGFVPAYTADSYQPLHDALASLDAAVPAASSGDS